MSNAGICLILLFFSNKIDHRFTLIARNRIQQHGGIVQRRCAARSRCGVCSIPQRAGPYHISLQDKQQAWMEASFYLLWLKMEKNVEQIISYKMPILKTHIFYLAMKQLHSFFLTTQPRYHYSSSHRCQTQTSFIWQLVLPHGNC